MTLAAGKRLGSYEILALIGVGGMGEVYRARDTRLDRIVAIKILPDHVAGDPDFRQRFEREARTISSLNHPHICTLYDVGSENGVDFLVMELLEGETLTQRLAKGPLPFPQALRYGIEIAEALDRAHRQGVTHRDLKPGNVMITKSGAKLLDFGLAKLKPISPVQLSGAAATAARDPLTASGTILGTLQYMAPEQVEGGITDYRADIFSFGAIVYEMATGKKAFDGGSQASLIGAILKDDPRPISTLQPLSPPGFDALIATCLAKDPDERWQSAGDVARQLRFLQGGSSHPSLPVPSGATGVGRGWRRSLPLAAGAFALGVVMAGAVYTLTRQPPTPWPVTRLVIPAAIQDTLPYVSISTDGRRIGFVAGSPPLVQIRDLDEFSQRSVAGTEGASLPPCFSPDGEWIAFGVDNLQLKKVSVNGGVPLTLVDRLPGVDRCDWGEDGHIYFGAGVGIARVPGDGGDVELVVEPELAQGEVFLERPQLLPGGRRLLFTVLGAGGSRDVQAVVLDLDTGERRTVVEGGDGYFSYASASPGLSRGYLVSATNGVLLAAPFDLAELSAGAARPIGSGVAGPNAIVGASWTGTLAYFGGSVAQSPDDSELVWIGRDGAEQRLPESPHDYTDLQISPDGQWAAVGVSTNATSAGDLWLYDLDGDRRTKLTFAGINATPVWTRDGRHVIHTGADTLGALVGGSGELRYVPADQSAAVATLSGASVGRQFLPSSLSPDGTILIGTLGPPRARDLAVVTLAGAALSGGSSVAEAREFLTTPFDEGDPMFSPDGRYIAYVSNELGSQEIFVVPYPGPGGKVQVSRGGGAMPRWNPNGGELFYVSATNELMVVDVTTTPAQAPRRLLSLPPLFDRIGYAYDVDPDGTRFLVRKAKPATASQVEVRVVVNWIEELERGAAVAR